MATWDAGQIHKIQATQPFNATATDIAYTWAATAVPGRDTTEGH